MATATHFERQAQSLKTQWLKQKQNPVIRAGEGTYIPHDKQYTIEERVIDAHAQLAKFPLEL